MSDSAKQRQATRRAKMASEGKKDVTLSAVKIEHIEPLKEAVRMLEIGEAKLTKDGKIAVPIRDKREEQRLSGEVSKVKRENERLRAELGKAQKAFEVQRENAVRAELGRERAIKTAEQHHTKAKQLESELGRFESVWFGFYKKSKPMDL